MVPRLLAGRKRCAGSQCGVQRPIVTCECKYLVDLLNAETVAAPWGVQSLTDSQKPTFSSTWFLLVVSNKNFDRQYFHEGYAGTGLPVRADTLVPDGASTKYTIRTLSE